MYEGLWELSTPFPCDSFKQGFCHVEMRDGGDGEPRGLLCSSAVHRALPGQKDRKGHFLLYLKVSLSFPYAMKREQALFDIRVRREKDFLSSFCHKKKDGDIIRGKRMPFPDTSPWCSHSSLGSEDGDKTRGPKGLTSFRKQAVGMGEMQHVETMERKVLVEPRSTGRGASL